MSMHKISLTKIEEDGLRAHGLDIGTPSQLSDAFRHGVAWALKAGQGEAVAWRNFDGEGGYDYTGCEDIANRWEANNGARYAHWLEPLYNAPPASADAVPVPRELARRLTSSDNHVRQTARRELRVLIYSQEVKS